MKKNATSPFAGVESLPFRERLAGVLFRSRRRLATGGAVMIAILLGYHVVVGQNGLTAYQAKRLEDRTLSKQIQDLRNENSQLKAHVDRLQSSPAAIEHEAREKLHYTRPGEVIYTLDQKPSLDDKRVTDKGTMLRSAPIDAAAVDTQR